jgi:hypothetical protein
MKKARYPLTMKKRSHIGAIASLLLSVSCLRQGGNLLEKMGGLFEKTDNPSEVSSDSRLFSPPSAPSLEKDKTIKLESEQIIVSLLDYIKESGDEQAIVRVLDEINQLEQKKSFVSLNFLVQEFQKFIDPLILQQPQAIELFKQSLLRFSDKSRLIPLQVLGEIFEAKPLAYLQVLHKHNLDSRCESIREIDSQIPVSEQEARLENRKNWLESYLAGGVETPEEVYSNTSLKLFARTCLERVPEALAKLRP